MDWLDYLTWRSSFWPDLGMAAALAWVFVRLERAERAIDRLELQLDAYQHQLPDDIPE